MFRNISLAALLCPVILAACGTSQEPGGNTDNTEQQSLMSLAQADDGTISVELLAKSALHVGRNVVYYRVKEVSSGKVLTDATVTHMPMMTMSNHSHSCPYADPATPASGQDTYQGEIVFIMASGAMGTWDIGVTVVRSGSDSRQVTLKNVAVADSSARKDLSVPNETATDTYIVTLNFDDVPKVGSNPFVLTVHKKGGMSGGFPAQTDLDITVTPQMTSMGHGSSGNTNPSHTANGNYPGSVNFTMAGAWAVEFTLKRAEATLGVVHYDLTM